MATLEWRRFCCAVDFSEPSRSALRVAADLCRRLGAELVLLHAGGVPKVAEELPPAQPIERQLAAWKEEAERLGVSRVTLARAEGPADVAVVEYARSHGVDLLVVGTHGRVDREHMLTGSVAEGIVRNAECPVLTVRAA